MTSLPDSVLSDAEELDLAARRAEPFTGGWRKGRAPRCARCKKQVEYFTELSGDERHSAGPVRVLVAICHGAREVVRLSGLVADAHEPLRFGEAFRDETPELPGKATRELPPKTVRSA